MSVKRDEFLEEAKALKSAANRGGVNGLGPYKSGKLPEGLKALYSSEEAEGLETAGVPGRMRVKISEHYNDLATGFIATIVGLKTWLVPASKAIANLVTAKDEEVADMSGEDDPSGQKDYMLADGILHKYEMALLYVVTTCSAHCRYCYRFDFLSKNATESGKKIAKIAEVVDYVEAHNREAVASKDGINSSNGRPILREVLLSGGDPMVMSNKKLAEWLSALAETEGVDRIRIGTKELAFFPYRFDRPFFDMIDKFHDAYPDIKLTFAVHFTHPDEFLQRDEAGDYIKNDSGSGYKWWPVVDQAVEKLTERRGFITVANQTPIIKDVNDDPKALHILQKELYSHGVENHYFFQGRMIVGHKNFTVPVEETFGLVQESRRGLSGVEKHAVLTMSTNEGKVEVVGVVEATAAMPKCVIFKVIRAPGDAKTQDAIVIAKSDPTALWITDYVERGLILSDPEQVFSDKRSRDKMGAAVAKLDSREASDAFVPEVR